MTLPLLIALFVLLLGYVTAGAGSVNVTAAGFDWILANTSIEIVDVAYCKPSSYEKYKLTGLLEGFQVTTGILTFNAFVGVLPLQKSIYVVFGGSSTVLDWLFDFDVQLTPYGGCTGCKVHQGYYFDQKITFPIVLPAVKMLQLWYPHYKVVVTGHSKGAAQATLTALDLIAARVRDVTLINFGSPRVGNQAFAEYASSKLGKHYRVTHHMDTILNVPTRKQEYMHITGEWYEHPTLSVVQCSDYEDPTCNAQWGAKLGFDKNNDADTVDTPDDPSLTPPVPPSSSTPLVPVPEIPPALQPIVPDWLGLLQQGAKDHMHYLGRDLGCKYGDADETTTHQKLTRFAIIVMVCVVMMLCVVCWVVVRNGAGKYFSGTESRTARLMDGDTETSPLLTTAR